MFTYYWLRKDIYFNYFSFSPKCVYLLLLSSLAQKYLQDLTTVKAEINKRNLKYTMTYCKCLHR